MSSDDLFLERSKPFHLTMGKYYALRVSTDFLQNRWKIISEFSTFPFFWNRFAL